MDHWVAIAIGFQGGWGIYAAGHKCDLFNWNWEKSYDDITSTIDEQPCKFNVCWPMGVTIWLFNIAMENHL